MKRKIQGPHVSQIVAPVLAAFTLPTIAGILASPPPHWRNTILALFLAATGLLLASFQLGAGRLLRNTKHWNETRAILAFLGIIALTGGLGLLVVATTGLAWEIDIALIVLAGGVLIPIAINFSLWLTEKGAS